MASGFFAVLDDIAALMDDVAITSKMAMRKTAGILGDDLAVNAEKATGFSASRELPVLWAITKGSFLNKLIIVPIVLFLNSFLPVLIIYILVGGGIYLAYEGVEKIFEFIFHRHQKSAVTEISTENSVDSEKKKIRSAIITDFILSIEIVIIGLSTVLMENFTIQLLTVSVVAILATIGVYGVVAMIVRMDDIGFWLIRKAAKKGKKSKAGPFLIHALPRVIKGLSVIGTFALILVAGGIFVHQIDFLRDLIPEIPSFIKEIFTGLAVGVIAFILWSGIKKLFSFRAKSS